MSSTYMISLGTGLASTPATSSNCSIALVFFWPTDGGNFIRWLLKYTPLALKSGNLIPPVSWNNEKKNIGEVFFSSYILILDRFFKYRISLKRIFPRILSDLFSKISEENVKIFEWFPSFCDFKKVCYLGNYVIKYGILRELFLRLVEILLNPHLV